MKLIRLGTTNAHKLAEVGAILAPFGYAVRGVDDLGDFNVDEDGDTFAANAIKKAQELARRTGTHSIADDSGICVDALRGAPGIHSARWAGITHGPEQDEANRQKLLAELRGVPAGLRTAHYTCVIAYCTPDAPPLTFEGRLEGRLLEAPRGQGGFGYDPLFAPLGMSQTVAELSPELKNRISHRAQALYRFVAFLGAGG